MSNKLIFIIPAFLIFGSVAMSQNGVIRGECGVGTFYMKDLKAFQTSMIPDLGVNIESISKFPPYFGYGLSLVYFINPKMGLGITGDFFSTGGRNYYKDYSGSYSFDLLTHAYNIGTVLSFTHITSSHLTTFIEIQQGVKISKLTMSEKIIITDPVMSESYDLKSTSWWIKPGYRIEFKLFKGFSAGAFLGAEFNPGSILHLESNRDATLRNKDGKLVHINWSGLRFALHFSGNLSDLQSDF
jgi:hypothetical protein